MVRDFVPVNIAGEGALFDTVNGVVYRNVGTGTFAKGKTLDRMGWVVCTSETLTLDAAARENIVPETPAKITLTANAVWTAEDLERVPADSTVDLNGFTLETTVETGTRNRNFQLVGKGGTFVVTVPAGQVYSACPDLMQGTISLVKRGAGTFVALGGLVGADNIIVEEGLMEMGQGSPSATYCSRVPFARRNTSESEVTTSQGNLECSQRNCLIVSLV